MIFSNAQHLAAGLCLAWLWPPTRERQWCAAAADRCGSPNQPSPGLKELELTWGSAETKTPLFTHLAVFQMGWDLNWGRN